LGNEGHILKRPAFHHISFITHGLDRQCLQARPQRLQRKYRQFYIWSGGKQPGS
jgi:hypothetical protein